MPCAADIIRPLVDVRILRAADCRPYKSEFEEFEGELEGAYGSPSIRGAVANGD